MENYRYNNPVIRGYNPDPSCLRVGEDFYLVNSTFEFFPGVPIYHSKNLVNWELVNYCLTDEEQLPLKDCRPSGGIYAPTLRCHNGRFYMVTTNTTHGGNFYVYTDDIRGKWSKPVWVKQGGIDPSLLFDGDKVYFTSTHRDEEGKSCIALCEINIETGEQLTPSTVISHGCGGKHCEGPHLYTINGYYYLLLAEGGTEYGHMATLQRSRSPYGPFEACPHNPILSHKDEQYSRIQATGHTELFEDQNGNWWLVCLAIRMLSRQMLHNLGRETFLAPVTWTPDGWPVVGNNGRIAETMQGPLPAAPQPCSSDFYDGFSGGLDPQWAFVRNPAKENYTTGGQGLCLRGTDQSLNDYAPGFMGIRQKEFACTAGTEMTATFEKEGGKAGVTAFYNMQYHYDLCLTRENGAEYVQLLVTVHGFTAVAAKALVSYKNSMGLKMETGEDAYVFSYSTDGGEYTVLGSAATAGLCTEGTMTMTFTGVFLGLFAENATLHARYFAIKHAPAE